MSENKEKSAEQDPDDNNLEWWDSGPRDDYNLNKK